MIRLFTFSRLQRLQDGSAPPWPNMLEQRARHYRHDAANLRRQIRQMPNRIVQVNHELFGRQCA